MIVMKFGGSSVANRAQIEKVRHIVAAARDRAPVVVSSAHKGVTDALIDTARAAAEGKDDGGEAVIAKQHAIAESLGCPAALLAEHFAEIRDLLRGIRLVGELSPRSLDYISSFGERMSVRCIADFFSRQGVKAQAFDAWDLGFITDGNFGRARPVADFPERLRKAFDEKVPSGVVPIITGFVAKNEGGVITTLGRNGSDLTASLVGAALRAEEVQIWSDTNGVMTADPGIVEGAKSIPHMRFDEAAELAFFGSRVLHPATLLPAIEADIVVRVLNTNRPDHPGTAISANPPERSEAFTSVAYKEGQTVLTIAEPRMFESVGFLAKVFTQLAESGAVIDMVATSEVSVSVTSHDGASLRAAERHLRALGETDLREGMSILAVVGRGIHTTPGIGARVMKALGTAGVNIEMHSFGMASNNISLVVKDGAIARAVPALHDALFEA
ncbi:MAG: aspartate kinase [Nannocystaceae bacterium]|nr:aspartate kinase [bacterium]